LNKKTDQQAIISLSALVAAIFGLVTFYQLKVGDFAVHIRWAKKLVEKGYIFQPGHQLFPKLLVVVRALLPFEFFARMSKLWKQIIDLKTYEISTIVLAVIFYILTAILIYKLFSKEWENAAERSKKWLAAGLTVAVMLLGPIFVFTFPQEMYLGYINGNPFHNSTYILMRPLALLLFFYSLNQLYAKPRWLAVFIGAILIFAVTYAKPNFTFTFLPTLGFFVLLCLRNFRRFNWRYLMGGLAIPGVFSLALQYFLMYTGDQRDKILFAPFKALLLYVPNVFVLFIFILLSILFPLLFTLFYWKRSRREILLQIGWLNFAVALVTAILLTEQINMPSLNFWWGVMVAAFLLFVITTLLAIRYNILLAVSRAERIKKGVLIFVFGLHLVCGLVYYFSSILNPHPII